MSFVIAKLQSGIEGVAGIQSILKLMLSAVEIFVPKSGVNSGKTVAIATRSVKFLTKKG